MRWVALGALGLSALLLWWATDGDSGQTDRAERRVASPAADAVASEPPAASRNARQPQAKEGAPPPARVEPPASSWNGAVVWGVATSAGEPVFGATVQAVEVGGTYVAAESGTGADGRYVLEIARGGAYRIQTIVQVGTGLRPPSPTTLELGPAQRVRVDVEFKEGMTLSGVVKTPDGTPGRGLDLAAVALSERPALHHGLDRIRKVRHSATRSDSMGRFNLRGLDPTACLIVSESAAWLVDPVREAVPGHRDLVVRVVRAVCRTLDVVDADTGRRLPGFTLRAGDRTWVSPPPALAVQYRQGAAVTVSSPGYESARVDRLEPGVIGRRSPLRVALQRVGAPRIELHIEDYGGRPVSAPVATYHRWVDLSALQRPGRDVLHRGVAVLERRGPGRFETTLPAGQWVLAVNDEERWGLTPAVTVRADVPSAEPVQVRLGPTARVTVRLRPGDDPGNWRVSLVTSRSRMRLEPGVGRLVPAGNHSVVWGDVKSPRRTRSQELALAHGDDRIVERPLR